MMMGTRKRMKKKRSKRTTSRKMRRTIRKRNMTNLHFGGLEAS